MENHEYQGAKRQKREQRENDESYDFKRYNKEAEEQLRKTIELIKNESVKPIWTEDGVRLGDYQSNITLNFKTESK